MKKRKRWAQLRAKIHCTKCKELQKLTKSWNQITWTANFPWLQGVIRVRTRTSGAGRAAEVGRRLGGQERRCWARRKPHFGLGQLPVDSKVDVEGRERVAQVLPALVLVEPEAEIHGSPQLIEVLVGYTLGRHPLRARARLAVNMTDSPATSPVVSFVEAHAAPLSLYLSPPLLPLDLPGGLLHGHLLWQPLLVGNAGCGWNRCWLFQRRLLASADLDDLFLLPVPVKW